MTIICICAVPVELFLSKEAIAAERRYEKERSTCIQVAFRARTLTLTSPPPPPPSLVGWLCVSCPTPLPSWIYVIFSVLGQKRGWPLFRGSKVLQLNSDSFCDYVRIWTKVIGHLWAELGFWLFPEKRWKYSRPRTFGEGANILAGRAGTTAGTVWQWRRPYKLGGLRADPHLRTAWRRGNITWTRALQPDWEGVRSWRFCEPK